MRLDDFDDGDGDGCNDDGDDDNTADADYDDKTAMIVKGIRIVVIVTIA